MFRKILQFQKHAQAQALQNNNKTTKKSTQCYAPAPRLGSLRGSPWGSHWQQASSTGPAAPAARATTHQGGGIVVKRLQLRLLTDALTGGWQNG